MNLFRKVCTFFDSFSPDMVVTRKYFLSSLKSRGMDSVETYRNLLENSGYVIRVGRGKYARTTKPGLNTLTYLQAWEEAGFKPKQKSDRPSRFPVF